MTYQIQTQNFSNNSIEIYKEINTYLKDDKENFDTTFSKSFKPLNKSYNFSSTKEKLKKKLELRFDLDEINLIETCDTENYLKYGEPKFSNYNNNNVDDFTSQEKNGVEYSSINFGQLPVEMQKSINIKDLVSNEDQLNKADHVNNEDHVNINIDSKLNSCENEYDGEKSFDSEDASDDESSDFDSSFVEVKFSRN